jgi:hypothetical protein
MSDIWGRITMSYLFKACILVGAAIVIAASSVPNPAHVFANLSALFADLTASLADNLRRQPHTDQSTQITQSTSDAQSIADVQASPPAAAEASTPNVIATSQSADQTEAEPQSNDALFRQFQTWAAAQTDAPAQAAKDASAKVVQDAPARFAENDRAPVRLTQKHRYVRPVVRNVRSELPTRSPLKPAQPVQNARAQVPPSLSAEPQWRSQ